MNTGRRMELKPVLLGDMYFSTKASWAKWILLALTSLTPSVYAQSSISTSQTTLPASNFKISNSRLSAQGQMVLGTQYFDDATDGGSNANLGFGLKLNYAPVESFRIQTETLLNLSRARFQAQIDDDEFADGFSVKEAIAAWQPIRPFEIAGGAVNQKNFIDSPLLISNRSFPGLYQQLAFGDEKKHFVKLRAMQAVPTSRSFDSDRIEKEKTPYYFTEGIVAGVRPNQHIQFIPYFQNYRYTDLPSIVAFNGSIRGNTVSDATPTNAQFAFDYQGYVAGIRTDINPNSDVTFRFEFQGIENSEAPETFNSGRLARVGVEFPVLGTKLEPKVGSFYNESDTAPAAYNSANIGHNNREGMAYGLDWTFEKYNLKISSEYVDAKVVNVAQRQSDLKYFYFSVETLYVEF